MHSVMNFAGKPSVRSDDSGWFVRKPETGSYWRSIAISLMGQPMHSGKQ
jgi:hypothetical protein